MTQTESELRNILMRQQVDSMYLSSRPGGIVPLMTSYAEYIDKPRLYGHNGSYSAGQPITERTGMFKEMVSDVRGFFHENRFVIYTIALLFLADHFFFKGQFRERIRGTLEKMLCKCEEKVQKAVEEK